MSTSRPQFGICRVSVGALGEAAMSKGRKGQFVAQPGSADDLLHDTTE